MQLRTQHPKLLTVLLCTVLLSGCAKAVHPGAVSPLDSQAYDALLAAQTSIDQARLQIEGGQIPAQFLTVTKRALNAAINSYNITRVTWLVYRHESQAANGAAVSSPEAAQLQNDITNLAAAISALAQAKGGK